MENNNSVCYVGLIGEIIPIEGADNIELALVGGGKPSPRKVNTKLVIWLLLQLLMRLYHKNFLMD